MYRKNIKNVFIIFAVLALCVASINFIVDPGNIYLRKILADRQSAKFSDKLFDSKYGIVQTGWNERLVKTTLAKKAGNFDCVVLGSSRIMQISSVRNTGNIKSQCKSLLNLGVSGGVIEDMSIFSYLIFNNLTLPKQVFINIDPWTFKFNMDSRYGPYKNYLEKMNSMLKADNNQNVSYKSKIIRNLLNGEYFYNSIKKLILKDENRTKSKSAFKQKIEFPNKFYSYKNGWIEPITLPDGSHMYSSGQIKTYADKLVHIRKQQFIYKIDGEVYSADATRYFEKLIDYYAKNGVVVNFIRTPYHPIIFKRRDLELLKHTKLMNEKIKIVAKKYKIQVYGSYNPKKIGCKANEFYDFMHAQPKCLNKINFTRRNK